MAEKTAVEGVWYAVLGAALQIPGAKVDRKEFLTKEFGKYCDSGRIEKIVKEGTMAAGVEVKLMDKVAEDSINAHTAIATSISFAAGIPGGLATIAAVPADIAQYYYHVIVMAQKLAYIYGFAELGMTDDHFRSLLTLLVGVMVDVEDADKTIREIYSAQFSKEIATMALGKALNKTVMQIAVALSYRLTGRQVFKSIWKVIPIVGGFVSGGITLFTFLPMCGKLKDRLHKSAEDKAGSDLSPKVIK